MARELGDFTPVDSEPGKGRLVREDENDASDDEDDDEKRRIVFTVKEKSQRQKIAEEIGKTFLQGQLTNIYIVFTASAAIQCFKQYLFQTGMNLYLCSILKESCCVMESACKKN